MDDSVVNQRVATKMLEKLGIRPDVASNGLEALQALERQPYDIVLMDVQMPEMDGLEAAVRVGDAPKAGFIAHGLNGTSWNLGAREFGEAIRHSRRSSGMV